jgi:branched-chain amino acid transport system substrate-binding protein
MEITNRQQEPFVYGSIGGREIYLRPPANAPQAIAAAPAQAAPAPDPSPARPRPQESEPPQHAKASAVPAVHVPAAPGAFFPTLTREPVRIAVAGPMTGADAAVGTRLRTGAEQAVADINAAGGILGRQVVLTAADDASNPRLVTSLANRLAGDGVKFVIGHVGAATSLAAAEIYQDKGIVQITPFASTPELTERGLWNVFRTCGRDDQQGAIAGAYIARHHKGKKVAIVYEKRPYGQGLADEVRKALNAAAIKEVMLEGIGVGEKDLSAVVARIRAAGADLVYWGGLSTEGGLLLRQMRDQGVTALVIAGDGITSDEFAALAGPGVEGTLMTYGSDARKRAEAKGLLQKLRARKIEADSATLNTYAALQVIKQAAEAVKSVEPQKVAEKIRSGARFKTVIGDISFDRKGDVMQPSYAMYVWKRDGSGKMTYAEVE